MQLPVTRRTGATTKLILRSLLNLCNGRRVLVVVPTLDHAVNLRRLFTRTVAALHLHVEQPGDGMKIEIVNQVSEHGYVREGLIQIVTLTQLHDDKLRAVRFDSLESDPGQLDHVDQQVADLLVDYL
jgi:hypothetical protein